MIWKFEVVVVVLVCGCCVGVLLSVVEVVDDKKGCVLCIVKVVKVLLNVSFVCCLWLVKVMVCGNECVMVGGIVKCVKKC